ncbi:amino acid racemase [Ruegeria sp.]|uniref:aspartate/glutamate racemase family protein n=1 Tax=Ruegeria sp. TaxID=1879320 RepID=UPI00232293DF|nr:amino acid racemase [Ruegeria sp.]MDA7963961.1 amino acid racemase [Ruegeria sp.]
MTPKVVGVLGGMGPEATILLQERVLQAVDARDDADHLPLLIDMNPQVPSRIAHLIEGTGPSPAPVLIGMAQRLEQAGASALAMPCNTAHHYLAEMSDHLSVPFLDMTALSIARIAQDLPQGSSVGFLASPAVQRAGVFDAALNRHGLRGLWPEQPDPMLAAIRDIKANGPTQAAARMLSDAASELASKGAAHLIVACSEFSLLAQDLTAPVPVTDTVDVLAGAIRDHFDD